MRDFAWYLKKISEEENLIRFIFSRLIKKSRLSKLFRINRTGYRLIFFPSSISMSLWISQKNRKNDEDIIEKILDRDDFFIDVGANIGHLSIVAAKTIGTMGRVFAFEPNYRIAEYCRKNVKFNDLNNVSIFPVAVGNKSEMVYLNEQSSDDLSFIKNDHECTNVISIKLDDFFKNTKLKLLKIDVEGYELNVLRGAYKLLLNTSYIYFEFWDTYAEKYGYDFGDIYQILNSCGFKVSALKYDDLEICTFTSKFSTCTNLIAYKDELQLRRKLYGNC